MKDIYFEYNYGKLCENLEKSKAVMWNYSGKEGEISYLFMKREIPIICNEQKWYDIITPYGYGGPVIESINNGFKKEELIASFYKEFKDYCLENRIVTEFVRFHPLFSNGSDFSGIYDSKIVRNTLGTNLEKYDNPMLEEFSKTARKDVRKSIKNGVSWTVTPKPENIDRFESIYSSTMDRNKATDFYYFNKKYFSDCLKHFKNNLLFVEAIYENKTIAAGLYFIYDDFIHAHLSGTLSEYLHLSPAYILKYATVIWGKEHGFKMIHYGGGKSNSLEDSLYKFKKQFSKQTFFPFYIGKNVWNKDIYERLCLKKGVSIQTDYFPAYR